MLFNIQHFSLNIFVTDITLGFLHIHGKTEQKKEEKKGKVEFRFGPESAIGRC